MAPGASPRLKNNMVISAIVVILLVLTIPLPATSAESSYALTTTRLNLRTCPATQDCQVLRTLEVETRLQVLERQGEWMRVVVLPEQDQGWVHSAYTQAAVSPARTGLGFAAISDLLQALRLPFFLISAVLVGSWLVGQQQRSEGPRLHPLSLVLMSLGVGLVFILNQFGPLVERYTSSFLDISAFSPLWEINKIAPATEYSKIIYAILLLSAALTIVAPSANGGRESFLQGLGTGFGLLPILTAALALLGLLGWLIFMLFKLIGYVLGLILIPFIWIFENLLLPVFRFLATPFVWLWENGVRDLLLLLATPFIWLWNTLVHPLLALLYKYILLPLLALAGGIALATLGMLPIAIVGLSIIDAVKSSLRGRLDSLGFFSQGMAMGFLLFDATLLVILDRLGILHSVPPLSLLFIVALPAFTLLRQMFNRNNDPAESHPFRKKFSHYAESSKVELISTCFIMPAVLIVAALSGGEDG